MTSIWGEATRRTNEQALELLAAAIRDCPGDLWDAPMWPVSPPGDAHPILGADSKPITDADLRAALARRWVERRSTPWSVAWHALEGLDYDLNGEFGLWAPPPPFAGHPHWRDLPTLERPWAPSELLGYIEHCRGQLQAVLAAITDEKAATPLPRAHRYGGQPYAWIVSGLAGHTTEHAAQIRQFITATSPAT